MVRIGGGSTKSVLSDRLIVYTKSRTQLLQRKYLLYETGCICINRIGCIYPSEVDLHHLNLAAKDTLFMYTYIHIT